MLNSLNLNGLMFIDVETVPQFSELSNAPSNYQKHWKHKAGFFESSTTTDQEVYERAGIYAEFGKIVCISCGFLNPNLPDFTEFRVHSYFDDDEKSLLEEFAQMLIQDAGKHQFCGHNIKEFDIPYIARRLLINGISLPEILNVSGKKPWEVNFVDTLQLWKFGDYKHYTSLDLLTSIFNIPTPKDDISGADVYGVYYKEKDLERIKHYCEKDVVAVAQLILKLTGNQLLTEQNIEHA
jgi:DNA polymerase elongation subunit (family B)